MLVLEDKSGTERLVLDGQWVLKLRGGNELGRFLARDFRHVSISRRHRRKWVLFGAKRPYWRILMHIDQGVMILSVADERRAEIDAFFAAVEHAKSGTAAF
ncbi:MAG TPA: hypothetical protein VNA20_09590 [Frankiaceae bacterium]|nr:hypothetical protein [Frankiaceae bacterium]